MDPIKEAFARAKQDIQELKDQLSFISQEMQSLKRTLTTLADKQTNSQTHPHIVPTDKALNPSIQHIIPTDNHSSSNNPTDNMPLYGLKPSNIHTSTGNKGVPTDRQTDRQTDQHIPNTPNYTDQSALAELITSLDSVKREVRLKFKKLTNQEMLVFSTIYQLEEEHSTVDYPLLAQKLSLSESSIRDYTQKIIKKGIPLLKTKENNKKIYVSISPELKKIASLSAIIRLREI